MEKVYREIIDECISIDRHACATYEKLSRLSSPRQLKTFWKAMSLEEKEHIRFWKKLLNMARKGLLPPLFESPEQVHEELEARRRKIGTALMSALHGEFRRQGSRISVLEVDIQDAAARRFYEGLNYKYLRILPGYYHGRSDACRMVLNLIPDSR